MYLYDANGNMSERQVQSLTKETLTFDVENRLYTNDVWGTWYMRNEYRYDASGELVKRVISLPGYTGYDTKDIYFDGIYDEYSFNCDAAIQARKYYMAFGRIIAHRTGTSVKYILADHLNSTSGSLNETGTLTGAMKYYPFGATRQGSSPSTDRNYTGQQKEPVSSMGAYYYHARFYSPYLAHFVSADPIAPEQSTRGLNRYSYAYGNPLTYNDPTSHCVGGLYCDSATALNIAACALSLDSCMVVFMARGEVDATPEEMKAAHDFAAAAAQTLEFWGNFFSPDINPFWNQGTLPGHYPGNSSPIVPAYQLLLQVMNFAETYLDKVFPSAGARQLDKLLDWLADPYQVLTGVQLASGLVASVSCPGAAAGAALVCAVSVLTWGAATTVKVTVGAQVVKSGEKDFTTAVLDDALGPGTMPYLQGMPLKNRALYIVGVSLLKRAIADARSTRD